MSTALTEAGEFMPVRLGHDRLEGCAAATRLLTDWNMSRYIIS